MLWSMQASTSWYMMMPPSYTSKLTGRTHLRRLSTPPPPMGSSLCLFYYTHLMIVWHPARSHYPPQPIEDFQVGFPAMTPPTNCITLLCVDPEHP